MLGGKFIPVKEAKVKKSSGKVFKMGKDMYSVNTNQIYRTICHDPPGKEI